MAKLSKLSPDQRQQFMNQKCNNREVRLNLCPHLICQDRAVDVEKPNEDTFDGRSDYLKGFNMKWKE